MSTPPGRYDPPLNSQYGQYGGYGYPPPRGTNPLAIVSLILAFVFAPAGLICGIIARKQIKQTGEDGDGLAVAGIIVSAIAIVLFVVYVIAVIGIIAMGMHGVSHHFSPGPYPSPASSY